MGVPTGGKLFLILSFSFDYYFKTPDINTDNTKMFIFLLIPNCFVTRLGANIAFFKVTLISP